MKSIPLTDLHNKTREVLDTVNKEPVVLTSYRKNAYVLSNVEDFNKHVLALEDCIEKLLGEEK